MATAVNYQLESSNSAETELTSSCGDSKHAAEQSIINTKQAVKVVFWCFDELTYKAVEAAIDDDHHDQLRIECAEHEPIIDDSGNCEQLVVFCVASQCSAHFLRASASFVRKHPDTPVAVNCGQLSRDAINELLAAGVAYASAGDIALDFTEQLANATIAHHQRLRSILHKTETAEKKLAERKLVDRAKGLLMQHKNIGEPQAYKRLQRMAMDKRTSMAVIASHVIDIFSMDNG